MGFNPSFFGVIWYGTKRGRQISIDTKEEKEAELKKNSGGEYHIQIRQLQYDYDINSYKMMLI